MAPDGIPLAAREARNGHEARILWFTGYSGAGKTTLAEALQPRLFDLGVQAVLLDGDEVRRGLCKGLGFSPADRTENIRRVAEVAALLHAAGHVVLCAFISPFARDRAMARSLVPTGRFLEIHVRCPIEVCIERDPRGLYAKALRGEIPEFTGVSSPYEPPENPEFVADTTLRGRDALVDDLLGWLLPAIRR